MRYESMMLKTLVVVVLAAALVIGIDAVGYGAGEMGQTFLYVVCGLVGFSLGYGVRAMVSLRRRREARQVHRAIARLRASINRTDFTAE